MNSKEKILQNAKRLFHRYGIQQTSVDSIIRDSKVTKSNFYYHFSSKDQLAYNVLVSRMEEYKKDVLKPTLENYTLSPLQRISLFYNRIIEYHESMKCENGCPFGNIAIELSDTKEVFRIALSRFFEQWRLKIERCIREGVEKGELRPDIPAETLSELILSHLEGAILMVKTRKTIVPLQRGAETILKILKK